MQSDAVLPAGQRSSTSSPTDLADALAVGRARSHGAKMVRSVASSGRACGALDDSDQFVHGLR